MSDRLSLPHERFNRVIGVHSSLCFGPSGELISSEQAETRRGEFLPTEDDYAYVKSLMVSCTEPGQFASWIAPPRRGINGQELDYDYVRFTSDGDDSSAGDPQ